MTNTAQWALVAATFFSLCLVGCSDTGDCTLIGCETGVELSFEDASGQPIDAFVGSISANGEEIPIECGPDAEAPTSTYLCRQNALFLQRSDLSEVGLNIHATDHPELAYIGSVALTFEPRYPNGEACGAACERAEATVVMEVTQAAGD